MKRLIALFLSLITVFLVCIVSSAGYEGIAELEAFEEIQMQGEEDGEEQPPEQDEEQNPEEQNPEEEQPPEEDENAYRVPPAKRAGAIVRLYLCSKLNFPGVGHLFIYIENLTQEPVKVGLITLEKDQGVSMGAFGMTVTDGWGVYYNTEAYSYKEKDFKSFIALEEELDEGQLAKLNKYLQNNNHWDLFINCVFFAAGAWNSCTNRFILPFFLPFVCRLQIRMHSHTTISKMYVPERNNVYHVKGNRSRARLVVASDGSVD